MLLLLRTSHGNTETRNTPLLYPYDSPCFCASVARSLSLISFEPGHDGFGEWRQWPRGMLDRGRDVRAPGGVGRRSPLDCDHGMPQQVRRLVGAEVCRETQHRRRAGEGHDIDRAIEQLSIDVDMRV